MGCACLFALLAAGVQRLALILMWLFTDWIGVHGLFLTRILQS